MSITLHIIFIILMKILSVDAEAVQRAAATAEVEGASQLEPTHLEIILPQLLLDF